MRRGFVGRARVRAPRGRWTVRLTSPAKEGSRAPAHLHPGGRRGRIIVPAVPAAAVATPSTADSAAIVCNEAESSWRGGYTVTGGPGRPDGPDGSRRPHESRRRGRPDRRLRSPAAGGAPTRRAARSAPGVRLRSPRPRRGGRAVECTGLENRSPFTRTAGSNPAPSAAERNLQLERPSPPPPRNMPSSGALDEQRERLLNIFPVPMCATKAYGPANENGGPGCRRASSSVAGSQSGASRSG